MGVTLVVPEPKIVGMEGSGIAFEVERKDTGVTICDYDADTVLIAVEAVPALIEALQRITGVEQKNQTTDQPKESGE